MTNQPPIMIQLIINCFDYFPFQEAFHTIGRTEDQNQHAHQVWGEAIDSHLL